MTLVTDPETATTTAPVIRGRSLRQIAWLRLKRDKVALSGGVVVVLLILMAVFAPLIVGAFGHPPNEFHQDQINLDTLASARTSSSASSRSTGATCSAGWSTARRSRC